MIHNLFPNDVYLEPNEHKYFDSEGNQYISFSALYGKLVKKFDADKISKQVAKYGSESADDLKAKWNQTAVQGTRIDNALERYLQTAIILDSDEDLKQLITLVLEKYKTYNKVYNQVVVYNKEYRVAGSTDASCIVTNRVDSRFHKGDWKVFEKGVDSLFAIKGQPWLNAPFEHLPNTKYTKITFQLSYYAHLFEELTGRKCERLFIDLIVPKWKGDKLDSFTNHVIPIMYLKNDIKLLLETFKGDILDMISNTVNVAVDIQTNSDKIF